MRRYLLDANAVSDWINDRCGVRARSRTAKQAGGRLGTCHPVVAELYYGAEQSASRGATLNSLQFGLSQFTLWPFDLAAAREYGRLFAELMRRGRPMQQIDAMIAAIAFSLGNCTVVTTDSDLSVIPGLSVENWAA